MAMFGDEGEFDLVETSPSIFNRSEAARLGEFLESWVRWRLLQEHRIPAHVEKELRQYLECGILCFGVAWARCKGWIYVKAAARIGFLPVDVG